MSKLALVTAGTVGVGAAGIGGFFWLRGNESPKTTFKEKYRHAWLPKTSELWASKLTLLKGGDPVHPKLIEAHNKSKEASQDEVAKGLLQEGCELIYGQPVENSKYKEDFKKYCSKTNKEASSKTWNNDAKSETSWDTPLSNLKNHDASKNGQLSLKLSDLQKEINTQSDSSYTDEIREKLKNWCEEVQSNIYGGPESNEFKQQELYCRKN